MTRLIFLDFDGTLIDSRQRLYTLFCELVPENTFSFKEYWQIKRGRINQRDLLRHYFHYSDAQVDVFRRKWMEKIEEPERLAMDVPFEGITKFLLHAAQDVFIYLITARQYPMRVVTQIQQFGWQDYFTDILVTSQRQSKSALIRAETDYTHDDMLVGDTGEDIIAGKELGVTTVAVTTGILSEAVLREYQPDQLLETVVMLDIAYSSPHQIREALNGQ